MRECLWMGRILPGRLKKRSLQVGHNPLVFICCELEFWDFPS